MKRSSHSRNYLHLIRRLVKQFITIVTDRRNAVLSLFYFAPVYFGFNKSHRVRNVRRAFILRDQSNLNGVNVQTVHIIYMSSGKIVHAEHFDRDELFGEM